MTILRPALLRVHSSPAVTWCVNLCVDPATSPRQEPLFAWTTRSELHVGYLSARYSLVSLESVDAGSAILRSCMQQVPDAGYATLPFQVLLATSHDLWFLAIDARTLQVSVHCVSPLAIAESSRTRFCTSILPLSKGFLYSSMLHMRHVDILKPSSEWPEFEFSSPGAGLASATDLFSPSRCIHTMQRIPNVELYASEGSDCVCAVTTLIGPHIGIPVVSLDVMMYLPADSSLMPFSSVPFPSVRKEDNATFPRFLFPLRSISNYLLSFSSTVLYLVCIQDPCVIQAALHLDCGVLEECFPFECYLDAPLSYTSYAPTENAIVESFVLLYADGKIVEVTVGTVPGNSVPQLQPRRRIDLNCKNFSFGCRVSAMTDTMMVFDRFSNSVALSSLNPSVHPVASITTFSIVSESGSCPPVVDFAVSGEAILRQNASPKYLSIVPGAERLTSLSKAFCALELSRSLPEFQLCSGVFCSAASEGDVFILVSFVSDSVLLRLSGDVMSDTGNVLIRKEVASISFCAMKTYCVQVFRSGFSVAFFSGQRFEFDDLNYAFQHSCVLGNSVLLSCAKHPRQLFYCSLPSVPSSTVFFSLAACLETDAEISCMHSYLSKKHGRNFGVVCTYSGRVLLLEFSRVSANVQVIAEGVCPVPVADTERDDALISFIPHSAQLFDGAESVHVLVGLRNGAVVELSLDQSSTHLSVVHTSVLGSDPVSLFVADYTTGRCFAYCGAFWIGHLFDDRVFFSSLLIPSLGSSPSLLPFSGYCGHSADTVLSLVNESGELLLLSVDQSLHLTKEESDICFDGMLRRLLPFPGGAMILSSYNDASNSTVFYLRTDPSASWQRLETCEGRLLAFSDPPVRIGDSACFVFSFLLQVETNDFKLKTRSINLGDGIVRPLVQYDSVVRVDGFCCVSLGEEAFILFSTDDGIFGMSVASSGSDDGGGNNMGDGGSSKFRVSPPTIEVELMRSSGSTVAISSRFAGTSVLQLAKSSLPGIPIQAKTVANFKRMSVPLDMVFLDSARWLLHTDKLGSIRASPIAGDAESEYFNVGEACGRMRKIDIDCLGTLRSGAITMSITGSIFVLLFLNDDEMDVVQRLNSSARDPAKQYIPPLSRPSADLSALRFRRSRAVLAQMAAENEKYVTVSKTLQQLFCTLTGEQPFS
ncbi:putative mitochondrial protein [Andalucia godoyi]|uniref:Putative mitochondrial protein n=1 Tax=Andalucia godoyi TaxID=505711 RepID=A0A8K0F4F2_ANDGO|nr:putative mitochondrial protein [Andalucia godoyi]|eukprot:ANDGO_04820.mRNA.1 putative mitochondrial protein